MQEGAHLHLERTNGAMKPSLSSTINETYMQRLAGERSYERGHRYFLDGAVVRLACMGESILATVQGTHDYRVKLWIEENALQYDCDCPVGMDGEFCKHCVAVGLSWLDGRSSGEASSESARDQADLITYLMAQSKEKLVNMLLERAEEDELYEQQLWMLVAEGGSKTVAIESFRKALTGAIKRRRFVEYSEMRSYVREIDSVAQSIQRLLKDGHGNEVRELAEQALRLLEQALNNVDDSDGYMRGVILGFEEMHLAACRIIKPDPIAFAKFLFDWEIDGDWEVFYGAAETYADLLGEPGLKEYRRLAEAAWEKVKPLSSREESSERFGRRFRIAQIMERYARVSGDVEALVAIKKKDLTGAIDYLGIADIYKKAGNRREAIEWAERGARVFPDHADGLKDFLIAEYHAVGHHAEALALSREKFAGRPGLESYQQLKKSADTLSQWKETRESALRYLREALAGQAKSKPPHIAWAYCSGHSILVEILLWEKKPEEAWSEAFNGGCTKALWMALAETQGRTHPAEAIDVYLRFIEPTIQETNNAAYRDAVEMLGKVKLLKLRSGRIEEFKELANAIRARHKAKRNLMRLMNAEGW